MLCTACDTPNENDARFCRVCGTPLVNRGAAARTGVTQALAPPMPRCSACGRDNPLGARFCVYCAERLDAAPASGSALAPVSSFAAPAYGTMAPCTAGDPLQLILRCIWFVLVGWWLGLIWTVFAWLFNLTIIGLPVGVTMLNMTPQVMTLRARRIRPGGRGDRQADHPFVLRALWFIFIGWWASLLWMLLAWGLSATLLLLPIGFWMFDRVPTITTLAQEP